MTPRDGIFAVLGLIAVLGPIAGSISGSASAEPVAAPPSPPALVAQALRPARPGVKPGEIPPARKPHDSEELDCSNCHKGKHAGVVRMYLGLGGRGTPMIPSHMFQVRVQCVACHIVPEEEAGAAKIVGQTFRPSEQACVNCHGEKYRGMLQRWADTLRKMNRIVAPKLAEARAALSSADAGNPRHVRARSLARDAEFNLQFVALGKGVHNVFYAADMLKLSNAWLDEALVLLGQPPARSDDRLVRGGYCAVLCHEQAGVKLAETVTFAKRRIPHERHVVEFGADCTACHSAELHRAVTATPATCASCHHSPSNERCESCHRAQSAFYRGQVETGLARFEPNVMVNAVGCTGCHSLARKHSRQAVGETCVGCHDAEYQSFMADWTTGLDGEAKRAGEALRRADAALARARRRGHRDPEADALAKEARQALALVLEARGVHNPPAAEALLKAARDRAEQAIARAGGRPSNPGPGRR